MPEKPKLAINPRPESEKEFNWNFKKFYGVPLSEKSEMSRDRHMFYRPGTVHAASRKELTTKETIDNFQIGSNQEHRKTTTNLNIDMTKQHLKRDAAKFYGESYKSSDVGSSKGSIFQENAAEFYGMAKPEHGEKPFKIHKEDLQDPKTKNPKKSVLNERRLKKHEMNMQRHPMFGKNLRRFWGLKSQSKYLLS